MKDFIKFTLASCLGVFLAMLAFFFFFRHYDRCYCFRCRAGSGSKVAVGKESILTLDFSQPIPEQTNNLSSSTFSFEEHNIPGLHDIVG
jgi:hypothetical protein